MSCSSCHMPCHAGHVCRAAEVSCRGVETGWLLAGQVAFGQALRATTGVRMAVAARRNGQRARSAAAGARSSVLGSAAGPAVTGVPAQYAPLSHLLALRPASRSPRRDPSQPANPAGPRGPGRGATVRRCAHSRRLACMGGAATAARGGGQRLPGLDRRGSLPRSRADPHRTRVGVENVALCGEGAKAVPVWSALPPPAVRRLGAQRAQLVLLRGARRRGAVVTSRHRRACGGSASTRTAMAPRRR